MIVFTMDTKRINCIIIITGVLYVRIHGTVISVHRTHSAVRLLWAVFWATPYPLLQHSSDIRQFLLSNRLVHEQTERYQHTRVHIHPLLDIPKCF